MRKAQLRMLHFRAVYEAPRDLARRQVLADWLLGQGDPHGELIALQFDSSRLARARASKLLRRHRLQFLGALAPYVVDHQAEVWEHGFLSRAVIHLGAVLINAPSLATLTWARVMTGDPRAFGSPWLRGLETIEVHPRHAEVAAVTGAKVIGRYF